MRVVLPRTFRNSGPLGIRADGIAGTVPLHQAYILLHSQHSPRFFPSRLASPLLVALRQHALRWSALVNVAWVPSTGVGRVPDFPDDLDANDTETYGLVAFARNQAQLQVPSVSMDSLEDACAQLNGFLGCPTGTGSTVDPDALYLYVCTHGARDCRCGDWGSKVADALREEIYKRKQSEPTGKYSRIVVGEVGHVGGHEHAANVLVFPHGEWLGRLRPTDVPGVLDTVMEPSSHMNSARTSLLTHWRGQMGLTKEEQLERYRLAMR